MADGFIHTVLKDGHWVNEIEGGAEFGGVHATKKRAVAAGRVRAMQNRTEHLIHDEDGMIDKRSWYGSDPASRPG
jgi:uncharacterized protein DUF2188